MLKKLSKDQELKLLAKLTERELLMEMRTSFQGLSEEDAAERLAEYGPNKVDAQKPTPAWLMILGAFKDPFVLVLALLMVISFVTGDIEAVIVMGIMILASVMITFVQEQA